LPTAKVIYQGKVEGASPLQQLILPPHARNTYPYHGEGDKGGEVDKRISITGIVITANLL